MTNPYAPPRAAVLDVNDPRATRLPAERGTRFGAALLDGVIAGLMVYVPMFAGILASRGGENSTVMLVGILLAFVGFVAWLVLTIRFLRENGQSIAKRLLGIKIVRSDGTAVSVGRVILLRNIVNGLIGIIPLYGLIDVLFIFSESRQCLHDKIADTIVIQA